MKKTWIIVVAVIVLIALLASCTGGSSRRSSYSSRTSSPSTTSHECYVCGKAATQKVGSYWYCTTHAAMVRAAAG